MKAIILVAGVGKRLKDITTDPKCLLGIHGVTLIERCFCSLEKLNIQDVVVVVGYKKDRIIEAIGDLHFCGDVRFIENPDFNRGSILSLHCATAELEGDVLLMDGDVYFELTVLERLILADKANCVAIDTTSLSSGEEVMVGISKGRIVDMRRNLTGSYDIMGEAVGFYRLDDQACTVLRGILSERVAMGDRDSGYEDILPILFQKVRFSPVVIDGLRWVEIDFEKDVARAEELDSMSRQ